MKDSIDQAVEEANACDGFRVVEVARGNLHRLYLAFYSDGEMVDIPGWHTDQTRAISLWMASDPTPEQLGKAVRIKLFAEAMCRFLNSGGSWGDMSNLLDLCHVNTEGAMISTFGRFGYKLLDSCINSEGLTEHIFLAHGERRAIRWVEDSFIETVPDYVIADELGDDYGRDRDTRGRVSGQEEVSRELPGREDRGDAGSDHQGGPIPSPEDDAGG